MARSIFGFGPMGAIPEQPKAPDPAEQRKAIESQASQYQVPANVLMALQESGVADTGTAAQKIAADMKAGKTVDQIVGPELMNRAYDIADKLYPKPAAPARPKEANVLRDAPAAIGSSIAGAAGSALKGFGEFGAGVADGVTDTLINPVIEGFTGKKDAIGKAPNPLGSISDNTLGDKGLAGYLDSFVSDEVKQDMADLTDQNADLFDPSTWQMGKRPTVRGAIYSAVDVFGSMAPVVLVGALTRSPAAAAAAGGAMSGGDAASSASQVIDQMAATKLEDGRSQLEAQSSTYQRLVASGMSPQEAVRTTKRKAEQQAAIYAAIPGALGGAATQKILAGTEGVVARLPWGGRVAGTAVQSGLEEGVQEAAEGMAGRQGVNEGAGINQSITAGTLNEAVLGALGGGPMGAMGGALSSRHHSNTPADGSDGGEAASLDQGIPRTGLGGAADQIAPPPRGPISQIAAAAPDMTPQPEVAPAPLFPDQKAGSAIRLYDPESDMIHDATVLGENENGIDVRIEGGVVTLSPEEFDRSRVDAGRMDEEAKAALKDGKKKPKVKVPTAVENYMPTPPEPSQAEVAAEEQQQAAEEAAFQARIDADQALGEATGWGGAPEDAAPPAPEQGSLSQKAQAAVQPPAAKVPDAPLSPADALARARSIEDHAKTQGWSAKLKKQHAALMDIANKEGAQNADVAEKPATQRAVDTVLDAGDVGGAGTAANGADLASGNGGGDGVSNRGQLDATGQPILPGVKKSASDAAQTGESVSALKEDTQKPLRDHAEANAVIDDALPGRHKQGVPLASVKVGKAPDGTFMVKYGMNTPTGGFARPMDGKFPTSEDALNAGASEIRKKANAVLRPGALKNGYNEQDQADARKILKWLGDRGPEKQMLDDGMPADLGSKAEADAEVAADEAKVQAKITEREKDMADVVKRPPAPVTPMEADPNKRVQPDMLGGEPVTETVMAKKEREKREWGRLLAIAEHGKSSDDMDFQGRKALIRPGKVVLRAGDTKSDLDRTIDTQGMDRDEIAAAVRGALREMDRLSPLTSVAKPLPQAVEPTPTAAQIKTAAAEADKAPTDAQKEAGNYKMGHIGWNGLDLTIETAKGALRKGKDKNGEEWSVKMPADYGYIKGTTGADGDHVDFYMGPNPASDVVVIVDQVDAETGEFDEHKIMLGFPAFGPARIAYQDGFSDGKGFDRLGDYKILTVAEFKGWLETGDHKKPVALPQAAAKDAVTPQKADLPAPAKPAGLKGLNEAENAKLAALQARFKDKMKNQINSGLDPEMVAIAVEMGALYVKSGIRRFRALVESMMSDMGLTLEQAQPYARNAYNHLRGDMELNGDDIADMDSDSEVIAEVRKMRAAEAKSPKVAPPSSEPVKGDTVEATKEGDASNDSGPAIHESGHSELEGSPPEPVSDVSAGEPAGTRGTEGEQGRSGPSGEVDGQGDAAPRSGRAGSAGDGEPAAKHGLKAKRAKKAAVNPDESGPITADAPKVQAAKVNVPAVNFTITDEVRLGQGGMVEKFNDNLAAIRTLKQIQRENRRASPAEQAVLARYVGWGGIKNAFRVAGSKGAEGIAKGWEKRAAELEELLEPTEYAAARNSTKAAHYTSQSVVKAIWEGARRLGFRGGAVLEPSVGSGNFLGLMPQDLRGPSRVTAVEYDAITAGIAKLLYPASNVLHSGFEKLPIPKGSQSLAIGNPPFGKDQLFFRHSPEINRKSIHNQFFLASMDSLAPGGILAMVVSHYLMDSLDNTNRLAMAERAELLHAIRLPSNAFEENANTEVVTDILFFRKHAAGDDVSALNAAMYHGKEAAEVRAIMGKKEATRDQIDRAIELMAKNSRWVGAETINDPAGSGETINVNSYFLRNKGKIIGKLDASGTMNGRAGLNVTMDNPKAFTEQLNAAIEAMQEAQPVDGIVERTQAGYAAMSESLALAARNAEPGEVRVDESGALKMVIDAETLGDSKSMMLELALTEDTPWHPDYSYRADRKWQITEDVTDENGKPVKQKKADGTPSTRNQKSIKVLESTADIPAKRKWGAKRIELLKALLPIKQLMKRQFMLESQDGTDQQIEGNRAKLNAAYDEFVKKHGKLNTKATAEVAFQMPDGALALGAEVVDKDGSISKSAIMSERITRPFVMAERADTPADALAVSLSERGAVDIERVAGLLGVDVEKAADMLASGEKPLAFFDPETNGWETADAYLSGPVKRKLYAARQAGLTKNVDALEAVQPKQWDSTQISPNIGSTWIPPSIYRDFLKHLGYSKASMSFMSVTNTFSGDVDGDAKPVWQTTGRAFSPSEIVFRLLNSLPMKVTYTDSEKRTHVDEQASVESQQKATELSSEFLDWVYQDTARREVLVDTFNERYNTRVIRQRDGAHLKMPTKGPAITLRRHQVNAIWRGITDKAVLYDHAVGAGKTFTAIARIMERRRMGLSRKPMVVVPNHLIEQWAADFKVLYPGANVLAAGKADFETNNRRRLFAKIASGDYDAVIIGHSSFNFIDIDPSTEARFLEEELRAANEAIKEAEEAAKEEGLDSGWRKPMGVAEAERLVTKIQTRLDRLREGKRDRLLTFEEMGIDDLTVDESHEFKNLAYSSRLQNVSGMGNKNGSAKATNLHLKARSLHERDGTSMAFLSGTPISNSVSEMYLILRNLVPNELREMGLENFDAWRSAFVSVATQWEPTESGGLKEVARLGREWTNMRALMDLYYSVADAVPIENVIKNYPLDNNGARFPIPPVKSKEEGKGDREMVAVKPDDAQRSELRAIVSGFESLPGMEVKERNEERLRLMDRARKVSLDARAVNPHAKVADGTGKIGATVDNVMRLYEKWNEDKGTQVIFLDRSVPKARGAEKFVAEYDDLLDKLRVAEADEKEKDIEKLVEKLAKYDPNEIEAQRVAIAGGWNAYSEIRRQLIAKGIPAEEIAFVQDANTDAEKKELFERVNSGEVRVILGSTPRMGAGTNIQKRLVGLHHVDVTWKPSDIEQREGRIVRFGNQLLDKYGFDLFQAEVIAYATEMTVDAKMWALNATKLKAINGIRKYDGSFNMEFEDEESANMAEMAALATGNPLMVERVMLDGELKKMDMSRRTFNNRMNGMRAELDRANKIIAGADDQVAVAKGFAADLRTARKAALQRSAQRKIDINGKALKDADSARAALNEEIARQRAGDENARWSVLIDGNKVTTADTANAEITRIFGTPGFEAAVKGQTEVSFARASAAIADQINRTVSAAGIEDSVAVDDITILGMTVEMDSYPNQYSRDGSDRQVSFSFLHGKKEAWATTQDAPKGTITQQGVRAALDKIFDRMTPEQQEGNAAYYAEEKVKAVEKKPELEAELGKPWPLAEDYEQKKARQAEVIASLEKASVNDQLDETEGEGDSESRFNASQPVAILTGDELGDWEDIRQLGKKAEAWYRQNLVGKTVTNAATGMQIQFAGSGARKIGGRKGADLFRMVPALREILSNGSVISSGPDERGREQIKAVHKISAAISLAGVTKDVIATVRETTDGKFHYDLSRDMSDGARFLLFGAKPTAGEKPTSAVEGNPVEINLDHAAREINQSAATVTTPVDVTAVTAALAHEIKAAGLENKVSGALVRGLLGSAGVPIQGRQRGATIVVSESAADPVGVMRHEIVHALRDAALWGQPYGLFTGAEWKALVAAARSDKALMARVTEAYPDLSAAGQIEEAVAEMYREWAGARSDASPAARIFNKVAAFLRAMASALRGEGFEDAAQVMERIALGKVGGRGSDGGGRGKPDGTGKEMRPSLTNAREKFKGMMGSEHWKDPAAFVKNLVTDAMSGKGDYSALALVPGRALFSEMGKRMLAAKAYLRTKEDMDSLRNDWHHAADAIAQKWLALRNKSPRENDAFMDLMHRSTLAGMDPSQKDGWKHAMEGAARKRFDREGDAAPEWVQKTMDQIAARKSSYRTLQEEFDQMSPEFQALYGEVLAAYSKMGDDFEKAVLNNIANATKIGLKRAERAHRKELERIQDEGLEGEERDQAIDSADAILKKVKRRGGFSAKARINTLRKTFESNRLKGPYFPLARFGNYFATVRDENGAVTSFSRFEKESQQQAFVREQKAEGAQRIEVGVMSNKDQLKGMVDPTFVADIENMLAETGATDDVMDAVWQRWLETLPDQSIRTSSIHRKGRSGFHTDAFRAFGKHMFHGAHQLARLEYGLPLEEHINDAEDEARQSADPNRAGLLVNEMRKRHAFTMNPTGSSAVASMSGAAFVWYLGASPAAALANISQTTVVGIPLMAARFRKAGVTGSTKALGRASKDFFAGRGKVTSKISGMPVWTDQWTAENSPNLSGDELLAMKEAVRRGTIDKTQAHDLASVAETGIEYSATREKWMKRIGWFFHQAERFNREVTFLANYRLAREDGLGHGDAIDAAADITWKIHFDYQNTSRPRFMQNDIGKVLTTFRQFTVNLIWRMFRDTHQALHGATKEDRAEARLQLIGVTLSMMAHAGIRGTWGYGLLMTLLGMLAPGADDDDLKEWLQDALLMDGDSMGVAAWNYTMGAALNGVPGQVLGLDLSERIGMPNLWFRDAQNNLEGSELASHYATEILGPVYGIADGFFRGASLAANDEWWRGTEAASPKVIRDAMKAARYSTEGVLTLKGDVLADGIGVLDALKQVSGFTPAKIAERYDINSRLRDRQDQIVSERSSIQREAGDAALAGEKLSEKTLKKILDFNERYPEYPITGDTIRQSARGRQRSTERNEFGVTLNTKLNDRLRGERAPAVYQ